MAAEPTGIRDRVSGWFRFDQPVTYRDSWRFGLFVGTGAIGSAAVYLLLGSAFWPIIAALAAYVVLVVPLGFAIREGDRRHLGVSAGSIVGVTVVFVALPGVPVAPSELGPAVLLIAVVLLLFLGFGYAFPDIAPLG